MVDHCQRKVKAMFDRCHTALDYQSSLESVLISLSVNISNLVMFLFVLCIPLNVVFFRIYRVFLSFLTCVYVLAFLFSLRRFFVLKPQLSLTYYFYLRRFALVSEAFVPMYQSFQMYLLKSER